MCECTQFNTNDDDDVHANDDGDGDIFDDKFVEMSMCLEIAVETHGSEKKTKQIHFTIISTFERTTVASRCPHTKHQTHK